MNYETRVYTLYHIVIHFVVSSKIIVRYIYKHFIPTKLCIFSALKRLQHSTNPLYKTLRKEEVGVRKYVLQVCDTDGWRKIYLCIAASKYIGFYKIRGWDFGISKFKALLRSVIHHLYGNSSVNYVRINVISRCLIHLEISIARV